MLKHCVYVTFKGEVSKVERTNILGSFAELLDEVPGMLDYAYGPNRDFENKSSQYHGGFMMTFTDREAHLQYEKHPRHQELGAKLVSMCEGGADGIIVFDLEV